MRTPAMVYPGDVIQPLARFLSDVDTDAAYAVDIAVDDFAVANNMAAYLVEPNLLRHIGMFSSFKDRLKTRHSFTLAKISEFN
jgi:hypothetical protein